MDERKLELINNSNRIEWTVTSINLMSIIN